MHLSKTPIAPSDEPFLLALYSTTREEELALAPWDEVQKTAFLEMQFKAQDRHYKTKYPDASFQIICLEGKSVGRLYVAELADAIRILDITVLPEFRNQKIGLHLINEILQTAQNARKPVQIYLDAGSRAENFFTRLGFSPIAEEGFHVLWQFSAEASSVSPGSQSHAAGV